MYKNLSKEHAKLANLGIFFNISNKSFTYFYNRFICLSFLSVIYLYVCVSISFSTCLTIYVLSLSLGDKSWTAWRWTQGCYGLSWSKYLSICLYIYLFSTCLTIYLSIKLEPGRQKLDCLKVNSRMLGTQLIYLSLGKYQEAF